MATKRDWKRVAERLHRARQERGYRLRSELVRDLVKSGQAKPSIDRILGDLERGARDNYSASTLAAVELWYGLPSGEIHRWLNDRQSAQQLKKAAPRARTDKKQVVSELTNAGWTISGVEDMDPADLAALLQALATEIASRPVRRTAD